MIFVKVDIILPKFTSLMTVYLVIRLKNYKIETFLKKKVAIL